MILFVNESYFANLLAAPVIGEHSKHIQALVVSTKIRGDWAASIKVLRRCSMRYASYRMLVDAVTRINSGLRSKAVAGMARRLGIPIVRSADVNVDDAVLKMLPTDLGLVVNFDQILRESFLARFECGVVNLHASRLPMDRGISPVLWAFARGDSSVWSSIYKVDTGLDTGPIFEQYETAVMPADTAFSLYERVCANGGLRLSSLVSKVLQGNVPQPTPQQGQRSSPHGWPNAEFDALLHRSGRHLISAQDIVRALRT